MKWRIVALVALLGVAVLSLAAANGPPPDLRVALLQPKDFRIRTHLSAIPTPVRPAFAKAVGDKELSLAEPGAKWQSGPHTQDTRLARRGLQMSLTSHAF